MKDKTVLTSVNIIENTYKEFKSKCIKTNMNLQKFVNQCVYLYVRDDDFETLIHTSMSGSSV